MTKNKMTITDGSGDGVGEAQRQLAGHAGKDGVKKEIFNVDIWCVIFEKMAEDEKMPLNDEINTKDVETGLKRSFLDWLRPLRLMSKSFDKAITPIAYHSYDLSRWPIMGRLIESVNDVEGVRAGVDRVMGNILAHCKYLVLNTRDNDEWRMAAADIMKNCRQLKHISWRLGQYPQQGNRDVTARNATFFLNEFLQRFSRCYFTSEFHARSMMEFFHAVELDSQSGKPDSTQTLPHVVEELYIRKIDDYVLRNNTIDHITFPPVKVLTVQGAGADTHMTPEYWDPVFNPLQLESLTLKDCRSSVLVGLERDGRLANLRTFKFQGCLSRADRELYISTLAYYLHRLFCRFRQLQELEVGCRQLLPMILDDICRNGGTLKKLTLSEPNSELLGLLNIRQIQQLRDNCCRLVGLILDIDPSDLHTNDRLHILSGFSNLRKLELRTNMELGGYLSVSGLEIWTSDPDFDAAHIIMQDLHSRKKGLRFELIAIRAENCPRPQSWRPHDTHIHEGCCAGIRIFYSRVNESGVYEQWGSPNYSSRLPELEWSDDESTDVA